MSANHIRSTKVKLVRWPLFKDNMWLIITFTHYQSYYLF